MKDPLDGLELATVLGVRRDHDMWWHRLLVGLLTLSTGQLGCGPDGNVPPDAAFPDAYALPDAPRHELAFEPDFVDFGDTCVGDGATVSLTLRNLGTATVGPIGLALGGAAPDSFAVVANDCPTTMNVGASCSVSVRFAPVAEGRASARLEGRAPMASASADLQGYGATGCGSFLGLTPSPVFFGEVLVGATSPPQTFTLFEWGSVRSGVLDVSLAGSDRDDFAVGRDECSGRSLDPGASCTIDVVFAPARPGRLVAALEVTEVPGVSIRAALTGTAIQHAADVTISPAMQDFGTVPVGCPGTSQTFTVTSSGTIPTGPLTVALSGSHASSFTLVRNDCTASLAVGESCEVEVRFAPWVTGAHVASLDVGIAGRIVTAALTGTGVTDCYALPVIEPATYDFGAVTVSERTAPMRFRVLNTGGGPMGPLAVTLAGSHPDDFVIEPATSTCEGTTVRPGGACVVDVVFAPSAVGPRSTTLRAWLPGGGSGATALQGTGL